MNPSAIGKPLLAFTAAAALCVGVLFALFSGDAPAAADQLSAPVSVVEEEVVKAAIGVAAVGQANWWSSTPDAVQLWNDADVVGAVPALGVTEAAAAADQEGLWWLRTEQAQLHYLERHDAATGVSDTVYRSHHELTGLAPSPAGVTPEFVAFTEQGDLYVLVVASGLVQRVSEDVESFAWSGSKRGLVVENDSGFAYVTLTVDAAVRTTIGLPAGTLAAAVLDRQRLLVLSQTEDGAELAQFHLEEQALTDGFPVATPEGDARLQLEPTERDDVLVHTAAETSTCSLTDRICTALGTTRAIVGWLSTEALLSLEDTGTGALTVSSMGSGQTPPTSLETGVQHAGTMIQ